MKRQRDSLEFFALEVFKRATNLVRGFLVLNFDDRVPGCQSREVFVRGGVKSDKRQKIIKEA